MENFWNIIQIIAASAITLALLVGLIILILSIFDATFYNKKRVKLEKEAAYKRKNVNPKENNVGDCAIRAISTLLNTSWDNIFDVLIKKAKSDKLMPSTTSLLDDYLVNDLGYEKIELRHPIKMSKFIKSKTQGSYLVYCHAKSRKLKSYTGHAAFVKDGVLFDSWDSRNFYVDAYFMRLHDDAPVVTFKDPSSTSMSLRIDELLEVTTDYVNISYDDLDMEVIYSSFDDTKHSEVDDDDIYKQINIQLEAKGYKYDGDSCIWNKE